MVRLKRVLPITPGIGIFALLRGKTCSEQIPFIKRRTTSIPNSTRWGVLTGEDKEVRTHTRYSRFSRVIAILQRPCPSASSVPSFPLLYTSRGWHPLPYPLSFQVFLPSPPDNPVPKPFQGHPSIQPAVSAPGRCTPDVLTT